MNLKKISFQTLSGAAALALTAAPAFADVASSNSDTGSNSNNQVNTTVTNKQKVVQKNDATITNNITVKSNTGKNEANDNTENGSVDSGNSTTNLTILNEANTNSYVGTGGYVGDVNASNSDTGSDSINHVNTTLKNKSKLIQKNEAEITNDVTVKSNTGKNKANDNTGDGSVETGNSNTTLEVSNLANTNEATGGAVTPTPTVAASNSNTGSNSNNQVNTTLKDKLKKIQLNFASVLNSIFGKSNTGKNKANDNTGNGTVGPTGNSNTNVGIGTDVNHNVSN